jgi:hypothetical protein
LLVAATFECGVVSGEGAGMMPSSSPLCPGMVTGNKYRTVQTLDGMAYLNEKSGGRLLSATAF